MFSRINNICQNFHVLNSEQKLYWLLNNENTFVYVLSSDWLNYAFDTYISDPVWNFTCVAYSLTSSKPAKNTKGRCFWHTPSINCIFSQLYPLKNNNYIYIFRNRKTPNYVLFLLCVCLIYQSWMFVLLMMPHVDILLCINHNCYLYCCCVSIIIVICTCPPGALIWLINLFYSILYMILILPCHYIAYKMGSISWFFPVRGKLSSNI
jgi:hypothetical protein